MTQARFAKLIDLAQAQSSERRRDLLREVTDLFFETASTRSARETALFDEVLQLVAAEMQEGVLAELSEVFAGADDAPKGLLTDLANHAFAVAGPILKRSTLLDDQTLIKVVERQSQDHINAVAARPVVSEVVSDAIVQHGDDQALDTLVRNDGASISRASMETVVDRARANTKLHAGVIGRRDMPLDLLNEMYFVVETGLRDQILERNASVDPATLDKALARTRARMRKAASDTSAETRNAIHYITQKRNAGELNARLLVSLYREAKSQHFLCGLAELTGVDRETAADIIARKDMDGLAMLCRAADVERPLFVTLAVLACGGDDAIGRAEEFGRMYNEVPIEAAQRAMRFFKVRKTAEAA